MDKIKLVFGQIKNKRIEFAILLFILLIGAFFRLYKISEYMTFLGDEGRDARVVRRLLVEADPILVGPGTSIGNMYLGPLYYYMMAPAMLLSSLSPVGPAVMIALLGVLTIALVWYSGREWFGSIAGIFAAILYSISPTVIIYSRSSWNPNIMPFFALLTIYSIWRIWQKHEWKWFLIIGFSFAMVLNSHYLGLLLIPVMGIFWLLTLRKVAKTDQVKNYILYTIYSLILFCFLMSPLVIFDARHEWRNLEAIEKFFLERQTTISARPWNALPTAWPLFTKVVTSLIAARNEFLGGWVALAIVAYLAFLREKKQACLLILTWLVFAILGLGLYKQEIYDHYFGFFFAAPFLFVGAMLADLIKRAKMRGWWLAATAMAILIYFDLSESPIKSPPNRQLQRTINVAEEISRLSHGERFNLAVIAERNYDDAYQYFLEKWHAPLVEIDAQRADETITNQLFVVCELPEEKCDPTHNSKAEVANFGWSRIEETWKVSGVILFKLVHAN